MIFTGLMKQNSCLYVYRPHGTMALHYTYCRTSWGHVRVDFLFSSLSRISNSRTVPDTARAAGKETTQPANRINITDKDHINHAMEIPSLFAFSSYPFWREAGGRSLLTFHRQGG